MESGVSGVPRGREWDATVRVELPELEEETLGEVELVAFAGLVVGLGARAPGRALEQIAGELDRELDRPYEARAVRQGRTGWLAGGRRVNAELVELRGLAVDSLELAVAPDGNRMAQANGEQVRGLVDPALDEALRDLEQRGQKRFQAFVARADRLEDERWQLTIDPL